MVWSGGASNGMAGEVRRARAAQGAAWIGAVRQAGFGKAWLGWVRRGTVRQARCGKARPGLAGHVAAWQAWSGVVWHGKARPGLSRLGRLGLVRLGGGRKRPRLPPFGTLLTPRVSPLSSPSPPENDRLDDGSVSGHQKSRTISML